jgi:hypothetical protein
MIYKCNASNCKYDQHCQRAFGAAFAPLIHSLVMQLERNGISSRTNPPWQASHVSLLMFPCRWRFIPSGAGAWYPYP